MRSTLQATIISREGVDGKRCRERDRFRWSSWGGPVLSEDVSLLLKEPGLTGVSSAVVGRLTAAVEYDGDFGISFSK